MSRQEVQGRANFWNYTIALLAFSNEFGFFPAGSNRTVTAALAGQNPGNKIFLHFLANGTNRFGDFVDPVGKPYDIHVTSNQIHIAPEPQ